MATEIVNAKISFVSLVDKAANKKSFAIIKSDGNPTFQRQVPILKTDEAKQIVTGIVYEPDILDAHNEFMTEAEIEKAAHLFMKEFRNVDKQHDFTSGYGEVIESWVAKSEMKLEDQDIKKGSWLMSVHVTDNDTWEGIQKGEITGFSMGGVGQRVEHEDEEVEKSATGLFKILKDFFANNNSPIKKGVVKDKYEASVKRSNFWTAFDTMQSALGYWDWRTDQFIMETDSTKVQEALQDFNEILTGLLTTGDVIKAIGAPDKELITKAGKKISTNNMTQIKTAYEALGKLIELDQEEEIDVNKSELEKMIGEGIAKALAPFVTKLEGVEKSVEGEGEGIAKAKIKCPECGVSIDSKATKCPDCGAAITKSLEKSEDIAEIVTAAINKAIEPLSQRLDTVEKARGIKKSIDDPSGQETHVAKSYMDYIG